MSEKRAFRLIPTALPGAKRQRGLYAEAIEEFADSGAESALVEFDGKSQATVYQGLYHSVRTSGRTDVAVRRREGRVYLIRNRGERGAS